MIFEISSGIVFLLSILLWLREKQQWNLPKGPSGLPILGSFFPLLFAGIQPHIKFSEWANIYGNLYTVTILTKKVLIVSCPKLMKQIFEYPASAGKFDLEPLLRLSDGHFGVTSTEGPVWTEQRRFVVRTLRQFGMGKRNDIQSKILSEAEQAVNCIQKEIEDKNGVIESPIDLLRNATGNTLWKMVRGDQFPFDEDKAKSIAGDFAFAINASIKNGLVLFPWLKWLAPNRSGYTFLAESTQRLRDFIREQFDEHEKYRQLEAHENGEKAEPRDMIDVYLEQMEKCRKTGDTSSTFFGEDGMKHSIAIIAEMFGGGGETLPHTLNWVLLYLSYHHDVQRKLQQEIDQILGKQEPCLLDKERMPYTEAVMLEVHRKSPNFPITTVHKLLEDIDPFCGFKLPKGMLLIANIHQIHNNKQFWGDPELFRPERFLPEDGVNEETVAERKANVVAFSVGKRVCFGEPLATDVLFLFVVKLFQTFQVSLYPENSKPEFESSEPFLNMAKPFSIVAKERR